MSEHSFRSNGQGECANCCHDWWDHIGEECPQPRPTLKFPHSDCFDVVKCPNCNHTIYTDREQPRRNDPLSPADDAEYIRAALESAIQRFGAGRLAKSLVEVGATDSLQTLADYTKASD